MCKEETLNSSHAKAIRLFMEIILFRMLLCIFIEINSNGA